jgi:hypothetical protein
MVSQWLVIAEQKREEARQYAIKAEREQREKAGIIAKLEGVPAVELLERWKLEQTDPLLREIEMAARVDNVSVLSFAISQQTAKMRVRFSALGIEKQLFYATLEIRKRTTKKLVKVINCNAFEVVPVLDMPLYMSIERILKRYLTKVIVRFEKATECLPPARSKGRPQKYATNKEARAAAQRAYRARQKEKEEENG